MRFRLSLEWFVIQRALQKLGVAQVAVNWRLTPDEAIYILRDSGAKGLGCNDCDASWWSRHDVLLITVGQSKATSGLRYEDLLTTRVETPRFGAARPSMVLYTSGTTGRPRGVPPVDPATVGQSPRSSHRTQPGIRRGHCLGVRRRSRGSDACDELVAHAMAHYHSLDIVVNNAGYAWDRPGTRHD
jgi:acyl-CoA synthetase (AMP-forming)/AMP-acid ligase II